MYAQATDQIDGKTKIAIPAWAVAWFAALMALTLFVRIADPTGWLGSDDAAYHSAAEHVLTGQTIQRVHHHYARMAVVLPVAASMWLFGASPFTVALPMLVASTLCVIAVVLLGRLLWGWCEGLLAATIVSVLPYFRVLSTTAFPDVHVCLWTTAAMLLAVLAIRTDRVRYASYLWINCGFALGLAISAKVFAIAVGAGIAWVILNDRRRIRAATLFVVGWISFQLLEGIFYLWAADDFFFSLRATLAAQSNVPSMAAEAEQANWTAGQMVWDRLGMLLHPTTSGWGWVAVTFWPAVFTSLLCQRVARGLALWALATYLLVALVPISFKEGVQPYPVFHGRHILPACVPFALCLAWALRRLLGFAVQPAFVERTWPIAFAAMAALSFENPKELKGFRDRATSRVGIAISQIVDSTGWDRDRFIFMTPSCYWRFRILFPLELRSRLRVAADDAAPTWWRDTCADIVSRFAPLPPPDNAYLIATPTQWHGGTEHWDYGVSLPREQIGAWQSIEPRAGICRFVDGSLGPVKPAGSGQEPFLLLLGGPHGGSDRLAEQASFPPPQLRVPPIR